MLDARSHLICNVRFGRTDCGWVDTTWTGRSCASGHVPSLVTRLFAREDARQDRATSSVDIRNVFHTGTVGIMAPEKRA